MLLANKYAYVFLTAAILIYGCAKEHSCEGCSDITSVNKPPVANAGPDQTIKLPLDSVLLDGSASFDPDGIIKTFSWKKIAGPALYSIKNADLPNTVVKALATGVYAFELVVTDAGGLSARDTLQAFVTSASVNNPPIACAGPDQVITLPASTAILDGSCSSDPDINITGYSWIKIAGPVSATLVLPNAVSSKVNNLTSGIYQFQLKVTDATGLFSFDTVQVTVKDKSPTAADSDWSFNQDSNFFFGPLDSARLANTGVGIVLSIDGTTFHSSATQYTLFYIEVLLPGSTIQQGTYSTSTNAVFVFSHHGGAIGTPIYYADPTTNNAVMSVVITSYNSITRVVQGIFSGKAHTLAGALVPITNGKFKAMVAQ